MYSQLWPKGNMKKIIALFLASFFIFFFSSNIFVKSDLAFAQEISPTPKVNYELPYPGLLPDSPIYFLRIIRDKTVGFLISDPLKKAEFNLLQADKRLNAGIYLFKKGKVSLAVSTISKAENYFEESLERARKARSEGMDVSDIERKLINSARKHQEELRLLEEKSDRSFKESFGIQRKRVEAFEKEVRRLIE